MSRPDPKFFPNFLIDSMPLKVYFYTHKEVYMRTNVLLDDALIKEALKLGRLKTKKALIHEALKEYVDNRKRLNLLDLAGKITFKNDYDYKAMREDK